MTTTPTWTPDPAELGRTNIERLRQWLHQERGVQTADYAELLAWSVEHPGDFWAAFWDFAGLVADRGEATPLADATMPGASWFPGVTLNYVDQVFSSGLAAADDVVIVGRSEPGGPADVDLTMAELRRQTAALAATLRANGVGPGDRVVGYLPNIAEAVIGFLATASLGAIWAGCGQDYSAGAAVDRLGQLEPVALITADGYRYANKNHSRLAEIDTLRAELDHLRLTVVSPRMGSPIPDGAVGWDEATAGDHELSVTQVPFDQPLWVLFSSGTTGKPKGIVHGHGGVLLEHVKQTMIHSDLHPGETFLWYTSPSWMMWNIQIAGLLVGARIVCYDGSPGHPQHDQLWRLAGELGVRVLGTSPAYLHACEMAGLEPGRDHDLSALATLGVTGSVLPAGSCYWVRDHVGERVAVGAMSGGTDVVSAFVGWVPTAPVWPGELSVVDLGTKLEAFDPSGVPVPNGQMGELVVTAPMPSMPVSFWNDPDGSRLRAAYFDTFPGIWRHGDWVTRTDHGSVIIHGRSDSTLNRNGVRMGPADIYSAVEPMPEVTEALVVGIENSDGSYWMPLFVHLADGQELTDELVATVKQTIRETASPKHVPDDVLAVAGIPHTRTGKKLEVPVKRVLQGADPAQVADASSIDDASLLDAFVTHRR
ncbi:MAG: acetoacetate--CoA ligase [Actinomycetales bacterium]